MHFHCHTSLVETFRDRFPKVLAFDESRSIVFEEDDSLPPDAMWFCVAAALTYHLRKKSTGGRL